jgi:hypothetical protein
LSIVVSQAIGALGAEEGTPVPIHGRWYYHVPALPLWALILLLLVVPKANRHRQAWLILIPPMLLIALWQLLARLVSMPDESETTGLLLLSLAVGWSAVWLLGHLLGRRSRIVTFFLMLGLMLAIGVSYCNVYLSAEPGDLRGELVGYGLAAALLLLPIMLAARSCRERYSPRRFLGRLLAWTLAIASVVPLGYAFTILSLLIVGLAGWGAEIEPLERPLLIWHPMIIMIVGALLATGALYLFHLPFLILAFKSPFYHERLEELFGIARGVCPEAEREVDLNPEYARPDLVDAVPTPADTLRPEEGSHHADA